MISYEFDLEVTPGSMPPILHMAQYDSGRIYTANLKNNGVAFSPVQGSTAKIKGRNPAGVCWEQDAEITGSTVTFTPEGAATDQFGIMPVQLEIAKTDTISTLLIIFDIQRAGYTNEEAASSPEFQTAMEAAAAAAIAAFSPLVVTIQAYGQAYICNHSYSEIMAAVSSNRLVFAATPDGRAYYYQNDGGATFVCVDVGGGGAAHVLYSISSSAVTRIDL